MSTFVVDLNVRIGTAAVHKIIQSQDASTVKSAIDKVYKNLHKLGYTVVSVHEVRDISGQTYSMSSKKRKK